MQRDHSSEAKIPFFQRKTQRQKGRLNIELSCVKEDLAEATKKKGDGLDESEKSEVSFRKFSDSQIDQENSKPNLSQSQSKVANDTECPKSELILFSKTLVDDIFKN